VKLEEFELLGAELELFFIHLHNPRSAAEAGSRQQAAGSNVPIETSPWD
jgi:hypothetical protein